MRCIPALLAALACLAWPAGPSAAPGPELPQVRVSRVQADDPGSWRLLLSGLREDGAPFKLKDDHLVTLFVSEGTRVKTGSGAPALATFDRGAGEGGRMLALAKSGARQAVVFVVAVHADVRVETWQQLDGAILEVLKGLKPDAQVGVVFYGDRIRVLWSVDGARADVRSVNEYQHCLAAMREASGRPGGDPGKGVPCGRLFARDDLKAKLDPGAKARVLPPRQGLFPRLFGIPETSEVESGAAAAGHERLDRAEIEAAAKGGERFADGAMEAALRMLLAVAPPGSLREVVVLSDGRDGYLRIADLAEAAASRGCSRKAAACRAESVKRASGKADAAEEGASPGCAREVMECTIPKVAEAMRGREAALKAHLEALIATLRAAEVRVSAVAAPGSDAVGVARLQALALKTGGTFRDASAGAAGEMKVASGLLGAEFASEVVAVPSSGLDPRKEYAVAAVVDRELPSAPHAFVTGSRPWPLEGRLVAMRRWMIGKLGHGWGPPAFWAAVTGGALMLLSLLLGAGKLVKALVKKLGSKAPKPPGIPKVPKIPKPPKGVAMPAAPKVPVLKRPS
ncbi:MAG: hypothetical protein FJ087_15445 [Deltaproteobacteria bacterium]|nr:hypothetical protein [Deltaproteobacteria bacterium]